MYSVRLMFRLAAPALIRFACRAVARMWNRSDLATSSRVVCGMAFSIVIVRLLYAKFYAWFGGPASDTSQAVACLQHPLFPGLSGIFRYSRERILLFHRRLPPQIVEPIRDRHHRCCRRLICHSSDDEALRVRRHVETCSVIQRLSRRKLEERLGAPWP